MPSGESSPRPPANGLPSGAVWQAMQSPARDRYSPCLMSWASGWPAPPSAAEAGPASRARAAATMVYLVMSRASSSLDQRAGALQVLLADRLRGPIGPRAPQAGGVVAAVLREGAGAHDGPAGGVPALQVRVHHAFARARAQGGAARVVGALVDAGVVVRALLAQAHEILFRVHRLGDFFHALAHVAQHVELVVVPVERHA